MEKNPICVQAYEDKKAILEMWENGMPLDHETGVAYLVNRALCKDMEMEDYWREHNETYRGVKYPEKKELRQHDSHDSHYSDYSKGHNEPMELTTGEAMTWVSKMENQDGTTGAHWKIDQTTAVAEQHKIDLNKVGKEAFYVALNRAYSDHYNTAKKYNAHTTPDFFVCLVKDDINDSDSVSLKERVAVGYHYIAKK